MTPLQSAATVPPTTGLFIAGVGMLTVFIGLVVLSLLLPVLRKRVGRPVPEGGVPRRRRRLSGSELAAISAAIHVHILQLDQLERTALTIAVHERSSRPWRIEARSAQLRASRDISHRDRNG